MKDAGKKVIILGNIPSSVSKEESFDFHMEDINHVVMKCTTENNVPFISLYSGFLNYCMYTDTDIDSLLVDGLHPNDKGYEIMFSIICNETGIVPKRPGATW